MMDTLFFLAAKLVRFLLLAETWIALSLILTAFGLWRERLRLARHAALVALGLVVGIGLLPVGDLLLASLETRYPIPELPEEVAGIVVLGGGEDAVATAYWKQIQLGEASERLTTALTLARRFPEVPVLHTGGSGRLRDIGGMEVSEAGVAALFLKSLGIEDARIHLEDSARNTAENARHAHRLAETRQAAPWVLITSAFHLPRAAQSFEAAGWPNLVPYPVDFRSRAFADGMGWQFTRNLEHLNIAIREHVGLAVYALLGR